MTRWLLTLFTVSTVFFSLAQTNFRAQDRWLALIDYAGLNDEDVKAIAPHFPKANTANEKQYSAFQVKLEQWKTKYTKEVEAFLASPEIKKLNPSRVHLGLQVTVETKKIENSYWQWINTSGLSATTIHSIAPHLPQPDLKNSNIALEEKNYGAALKDWMLLYPDETTKLFNHPAMKAQSVSKETVEITAPTTDDAYLYVKVSAVKPERILFNSGNATFDDLRYETYLKAWYLQYQEEDFYRIYYPEQLEEWQKNRDSKKHQ